MNNDAARVSTQLRVSRRALAKGSAWAAPALLVVQAAPAYAISNEACYAALRESSGGSIGVIGLVTSSNAVPGYNNVLQTKPLYDCAATPLTYCPPAQSPSSGPIVIEFQYRNSDYTLSPQNTWRLNADFGAFSWTVVSNSVNAGIRTIRLSYPSIALYNAAAQVQIGLTPTTNPAGPIFSRMVSGCASNSTSFQQIPRA